MRYQLVVAAESFAREKKLFPVLTPTLSKDTNEKLKMAHKVVDVVDRAIKKFCVTLLLYSVENSESYYAQVRLFARKMEDEFQQIVDVK